MSKPRKFPCLYNIVKKDDIETLIDYFIENPNYNIFASLRTSHNLYYHSIELGSLQCFIFLTNRLSLNDLSEWSGSVVSYYRENPDIFDFYYKTVKRLSEEENNYNCINKIILKVVSYSLKVYKELFDKIITEYDFLEQFDNRIFKKNLESVIVENKSLWITYFEKYYRDHGIDRNQLFAKCLIFSKFDTNKYLKLFKNMNYSDKIKIEAKINNVFYHHTVNKYSLEFLICMCCDIDDLSKLDICKEKRFEEELFHLFEEATSTEGGYDRITVFNDSPNLVFYNLMTLMKKGYFHYNYLVLEKHYERILKIIPYVSERFIDFIREKLAFENFDLDEYLRKNSSYNPMTEYIRNARILYEKIKIEYENINHD